MRKFVENLHSIIRRSSIDNDVLNASKSLRRDAFDRLPQKAPMVE
jgi:hypothetical protein